MNIYLKNIRNIAIISGIYLLLSKFFHYFFWEETIGPRLTYIFYAFIFIYGVINYKILMMSTDFYSKMVKYLVLIPFISIPVNMVFGSSTAIFGANVAAFTTFLLFVIFKKIDLTEKEIIVSLTILCCITLLIQIYQQYLYSIPVFGIRDEEFREEQRNGFYRFSVGTVMLPVYCLYFYFCKYTESREKWTIPFIFAFAFSVYLFLTRQIILACLVTLAYSFLFFMKSNNKRNILFIALVAVFFLLSNFESIFGDFIHSYEEDQYTTDVRKEAIPYIIGESLDNIILTIFGHGRNAVVEDRFALRNVYLSDIGFVGQLYIYGVFWIAIFFCTLYKSIYKFRKILPLHLRMFFFCAFLHSIFFFPYATPDSMLIWTLALYISSVYYNDYIKNT